MERFIVAVVLVLCVCLNLFGKPPQAPKPEQGPPVKEVEKIKDYKAKKTCPCSPQCECGCNEGKECTCGNESSDESQLVLFHGRAAQRRQARQSYPYPPQSYQYSYPVQSYQVQPHYAPSYQYAPQYSQPAQPTYSPPQRSSWGGGYGSVMSAPMISSRGSSRGC